MEWWQVYLLGLGSGVVASYLYTRLQRMCRLFTQCSATIGSLGIWRNDEPVDQWYATITVSIPKIRGFFADAMQDMLVGQVIVDEEGKGRSGGFRNAKWITSQLEYVLEIPKNRAGKLLLLTQTILERRVYILDHVHHGTPLKTTSYTLRVQVKRQSDDKILDKKDFDINITQFGIDISHES